VFISGTGKHTRVFTVKKDELRCGRCGRLLAKGTALQLSIKCPRCGTINHITTMSGKTAKP
jgi:phage FluMu protein Com